MSRHHPPETISYQRTLLIIHALCNLHDSPSNRTAGIHLEVKWGLLLPGAPEPRLTLLRRQDFKIGLSNRLRGLSNRSIVVVGNYCSGPITVEPYRAKARPLRPRRSCFAPVMVEAPGTAPGSEWFITTAIYRHSRQAGSPNIGANGLRRKGGIAVIQIPAARMPQLGGRRSCGSWRHGVARSQPEHCQGLATL